MCNGFHDCFLLKPIRYLEPVVSAVLDYDVLDMLFRRRVGISFVKQIVNACRNLQTLDDVHPEHRNIRDEKSSNGISGKGLSCAHILPFNARNEPLPHEWNVQVEF